MDIIQTFYDSLSSHYDALFADWDATVNEQALLLDKIFKKYGYDRTARVLDCACGIGTQAIGLASLGYFVTASDISENELCEAKKRAKARGVFPLFEKADFRTLSDAFADAFDIVIAMDNALPHMLTREDLQKAIGSIVGQMKAGGIFVGSIRDYDALLSEKPPYAPPYIHKTEQGQRVCFQTWEWHGELYRLAQYIIDDAATLSVKKFDCEYRATRREEMTEIFKESGCAEVFWLFPRESGFYQPIIVAKK